jgi:hypothetical protein
VLAHLMQGLWIGAEEVEDKTSQKLLGEAKGQASSALHGGDSRPGERDSQVMWRKDNVVLNCSIASLLAFPSSF